MISSVYQLFDLHCSRVIWVACVSAAMILFVYQVADRTLVYFDYNTTVSVKVRYKEEVPFPAVTICDINTFRFVLSCFLDEKKRIFTYLDETNYAETGKQ